MNYKIFKIYKTPVLLKLKKSLDLPYFEVKQQCCQTVKTTNPNMKIPYINK